MSNIQEHSQRLEDFPNCRRPSSWVMDEKYRLYLRTRISLSEWVTSYSTQMVKSLVNLSPRGWLINSYMPLLSKQAVLKKSMTSTSKWIHRRSSEIWINAKLR